MSNVLSLMFPNGNTKADADLHKKALQHVQKIRPHWSDHKRTAFCQTCKNLKEIIDFNLKIEDGYCNFWKNDMRTVVDFAKRFIDLLKWITAEDHRQVIVLNFAYYDFALIQKIYTRFYHIESLTKRMRIAMSLIEIFQIAPTLSSLNDTQKSHLDKIQLANLRSAAVTLSDTATASTEAVENIDDLLFEEKEEDVMVEDSNSMFTIDENEDIIIHPMSSKKDPGSTHKKDDHTFDDGDISNSDQPLRVDSYLPSNDRSGVPLIRTINIGDELSDINKQLAFISDIIGWIKQQIERIRPQFRREHEFTSNDRDTFNAILVALRKLLLDAASTASLCVSAPTESKPIDSANADSETTSGSKVVESKVTSDFNTSSYLRRTIEIVRDLTDECCNSSGGSISRLLKSILVDIASNAQTHHLVAQLLKQSIRGSGRMRRLSIIGKTQSTEQIPVERMENALFGQSTYSISECSIDTVSAVTSILKRRRFRILYVLSSSTYTQSTSSVHDGHDDDDGHGPPQGLQSHIVSPNGHNSQTMDQPNDCNVSSSPIAPMAAMSALSLNSPQIQGDDQHTPRIQHPSPLNLNKLTLKSSDHSIVADPDFAASGSSGGTTVSPLSEADGKVNEEGHSVHKYGRITVAVDVSEVMKTSNLPLNTMVAVVSDEMVQSLPDGCYRLNVRFYPMYHGCRHREERDFFYHRGLSLRDDIMAIIQSGNEQNGGNAPNERAVFEERNNMMMKAVLMLALKKQPNDDVIFQRFRLLKRLKDILRFCHGDSSKFEIFGSMATKLDHIESDLDVSIHLPPDNALSIDLSSIEEQIIEVRHHRIVQILKPVFEEILKVPKTRGKGGFWFNCRFLEHATVPIVKLTDENSGIDSDISVCLTQSVIKTNLIKKFVAIDWRVKPLVLSIKHWVKSRKLTNTHRGDLNSFGFTIMIIQYLQSLQPPILPILDIDVKEEQPEWVKPEKFVDFGVENRQHVGQLFSGFFMYYHSKFKQEVHAICITEHDRKDDSNGFLKKSACKLQSNHNDILVVLDPLDMTDNIGRRVTAVSWSHMQKEIQLAAEMTGKQNHGAVI